MPPTASQGLPAPTAIPTATAKITNAVSCVSRTTVRKRTIDNAPTRLNARATLSPITCVTIAIRTQSSTSVAVKDGATSLLGRVTRYTSATIAPSPSAAASRNMTTSGGGVWNSSSESRRNSGIDRGGRVLARRRDESENPRGDPILRRALRLQRKLLD